jgi:peroxiredoxin
MTRLIWSNDEPTIGKSPSGKQNERDSTSLGHRALRAGEQAPRFRLPDQHGHAVTLSALLAKGPVVLRFCRHKSTSPYYGELDGLAALHLEIERWGATLAVIAAQPLRTHPRDKDPAANAFLLLTDKGGKVARSYGLTHRSSPTTRSLATAANHDKLPKRHGGNVSAPATYIVDQESVVALAFVDLEGRSRMKPDQIMMALECLNKRNESKSGTPAGADSSDKP